MHDLNAGQWALIIFGVVVGVYVLAKIITVGVLNTIDQHKKNKGGNSKDGCSSKKSSTGK